MFRFAAAVLFLSTTTLYAADPAAALAAGRQAIDARHYDHAIDLLQGALPSALAIANSAERDSALAALHFYSAVASSAKGDDARTRDELRLFMRHHPGASKVDATKYPRAFVKTFKEVVTQPPTTPSFDQYYPGFGSMRSATPKPTALATWGAAPELQLLGSAQERTRWETLSDDDARREFIANFWVSRDPDPSTPENEWREAFNRRVVFADETFGGDALRGSVTDRGRVFVLLGVPARVYMRNIARRQGGFLTVNGTEEKWVYFKGQLPATLAQNEIDFRFLDQPAYGDHVLERDFLPLHALGEAQKTLSGTR
jgi:GWxTD domain-containing protein